MYVKLPLTLIDDPHFIVNNLQVELGNKCNNTIYVHIVQFKYY